MHKRPPTSQPTNSHDAVVNALRVPVIHLLAREPATEASLAATCRTSLANIRDVLPKIAKRSTADTDKWQLTDKSFREVNPYKFPYQSSEERQQAIDSAIKSFDRQRLSKDDKLWQILLPQDQRGQGICLSRSTVKAPEAKPKASTPMHKISDLTKKKPVAKKTVDKAAPERKPRATKDGETKQKVTKEIEIKPKSSIKEKYLARQKLAVKEVKEVKEESTKASTPATSTHSTSTPRPAAPLSHNTPSTDASKNRAKKPSTAEGNNTARAKPKMPGRDVQRDRPAQRPFKPTMPVNTKPKNPSPLSASPPINASDLDQSHPAHEALAASPAKSSTNSDRSLKRKANDIDSDIHNNNIVAKKPQVDRATPKQNPPHANGKLNASTPSSTSSMKRKSDDSSSSNTPSTAPKVRKVANIDTGLASRYHHNNPRASPGASSSSTTSPSMPSLSFRQTVELSQKFQKYYKKYEELYWELTEAEKPPTEAQRNDLLKMHKKLEEMKREIKAGAGMHHR
jgi:RNA polymerase II elongation factor ELL